MSFLQSSKDTCGVSGDRAIITPHVTFKGNDLFPQSPLQCFQHPSGDIPLWFFKQNSGLGL